MKNKCGGTGGSHGNYGGSAWSNSSDILAECLKVESLPIYGNRNDPFFEVVSIF